MSFHDRDYYGYDAAAGVRLRLSAPALSALLVLHLLVFLLFLLLGPKSVFLRNHFLFSVAGLTHDWRLHTLVTHSFAGLLPVSLLLGLLVLWWAGKELEPLLGSGRFLLLYLLGALAGGLGRLGFGLAGLGDSPSGGLAPAVLAVLAAALGLIPNREVRFLFMLPMKPVLLLALYFGLDAVGLVLEHGGLWGGGMAHLACELGARLGGLMAGLAFFALTPHSLRRSESRITLWGRVKRLFHRRPAWRETERMGDWAPREAGKSTEPEALRPAKRGVDAATAARVDELLAKIKREGLGALTPEEIEFLKSASEKYRT